MIYGDDEELHISHSQHPEKSEAQKKMDALKRQVKQQKGKDVDEHMVKDTTGGGLSELQSQLAGKKDEEKKRVEDRNRDEDLFSVGEKTMMEKEKHDNKTDLHPSADQVLEKGKAQEAVEEQAEEEYNQEDAV